MNIRNKKMYLLFIMAMSRLVEGYDYKIRLQ